MRTIALVITLAAACIASPSRAAAPAELFAQANDAFAKATALRASDESQARDLYRRSIELYQQIITEHGIANPDLYYNLANASALAGDLGSAILNYKRALRLAPSDADIASNYRTTRARVGVSVDDQGAGQLSRELFSWHRAIPQRIRFGLFIGAFAAIWIGLGLRLSLKARRWIPPWLVVAFALTTAIAGLSLFTEQRSLRDQPEAVVVADSVVGRKGPDARGYEPSFTRPLTAGVEVSIIERRADWALVRLADARETWLPITSLEEV